MFVEDAKTLVGSLHAFIHFARARTQSARVKKVEKLPLRCSFVRFSRTRKLRKQYR
jgi:hypothetical protein